MPVSEAKEDMEVEPDRVYVIPPNQNMAISDGTLKLTPSHIENTKFEK